MPRLFISHSSKDNVSAIAFKQWLCRNGWSTADVFLDLEDIGAGERWKDALNKANTQCEAVVLLASPDALASPECLAEVRKAEDFGKEIIVVLLQDVRFDDRRLDSYKERQIVDLVAPPQAHVETVAYRDGTHEVRFNRDALASVKEYLIKRGITPDHFAWPPQDKPDAEPFPGLSAFTEDDAGIFFGRDADIMRGLDKVRALRRIGRPRIVVIQSASGAGKSSYLRAGLWPRLGRDSDFASLAVLRPAQGILTGPEGLAGKLAVRLTRPASPVNAGDISAQLMADDASTAGKNFAKLMVTATAQALEQRRIGNPDAHPPAVVLAIDQAEELFAADDAAESQRFLVLLAGLLRDPPAGVEPFVLFTIRSDSAVRLFQMIDDQKLDAPETLPLLPLPTTSYRDVIVEPLKLIGQRGQRLEIDPMLVERLVADATGADALPMLAFTLSHLYQNFSAGGSITLAQYESMRGTAGVIDMALKRALAKPGDEPAIPTAKEDQLDGLRAAFIPWLARIDPDSGMAMRRVARLGDFPQSGRAMVERLVKARLLIADNRAGADVVEVAHESLLRQWPALTSWLQADADDLTLVGSIERSASEWGRAGPRDAWLVHRGERLSAAERLATRAAFRQRLGEQGLAYLAACRRAELLSRWRRLRLRAVVAGLAVGIVALAAWFSRERLRDYAYWFTDVRGYALTASAEAAKKPGETFKECSNCPVMVVVPDGKFNMGAPAGEAGIEQHERPQHEVAIAQRFAIAAHETTFSEWDICVDHGGCRQVDDDGWGRGERPVIKVRWEDAKQYVAWLSRLTAQPYRLLSEAEWEYGARAGSKTRFSFGGDEATLASHAWYALNAGGKTHPVGQLKANDFGLFDMEGNVAEWCEDAMHDGYAGAPRDGSAWLGADTPFRVLRGGSWYSQPADLRVASRTAGQMGQADDGIGFRIARTMLPPAP